MTTQPHSQPTVRVLAMGRSEPARTLSADARAEVFAAADELTAIGELGSLPADGDRSTLVLVSERARRMDSLAETLAAMRMLEPGARFVAVMEGRQQVEPIPGIDAWIRPDEDADAILGAMAPDRPMPDPEPTPPAPSDRPASAPEPTPPQAAPKLQLTPAPPADRLIDSTHSEAEALRALTRGKDPLPALLELVSARTGAGSLQFVDARDSQAEPKRGPGEHAAKVASGDHHQGWLIGPACISGVLDTEAATLALWLTAQAQLTQLRHEAYTDPLTGAWNRRYFERFAGSIIANASATRRPVTILLFDIDDFKHYNDAYGHEAGDDILRETVRLLNSTVRAEDRVCRIGGDEFAVVFHEPDGPRDASSHHPTSIFDIADRFCRLLRDCRFSHLGEQAQGTLTISGGLATYPWDGATVEDLVRHADRLILESKRQGKNVICYGKGCTLGPGDSAGGNPPENG